MERELRMGETPQPPAMVRKLPVVVCKATRQVDVYAIGAVGFYRNLRQPGATAFTTSLYEIDSLIQTKQSAQVADEDLTDEQLLDRKLPAQYQEFRDVFSKSASNILPPHR